MDGYDILHEIRVAEVHLERLSHPERLRKVEAIDRGLEIKAPGSSSDDPKDIYLSRGFLFRRTVNPGPLDIEDSRARTAERIYHLRSHLRSLLS